MQQTVVGTYVLNWITVFKGIKPDIVIVMGLVNAYNNGSRKNVRSFANPAKCKSFYGVFNSKQMCWKNMASMVNYNVLRKNE